MEIAYGTNYFWQKFNKIYDNKYILAKKWKNVKLKNELAYNMEDIIIHCIKEGCRIFDTAKWYKTEAVLGRAIKRAIEKKIIKREDIIIMTKLDYYGLQDVKTDIENSLEDLMLDYIDIVLIHSPERNGIINTWIELNNLVTNDKIKKIGVSNFGILQIENLINFCKDNTLIKPNVAQMEFNFHYRNMECLKFCQKNEIQVYGWGTFGWNKFSKNNNIINSISDKYNIDPYQLSIYYSNYNNVIPIFSSLNYQHLKSNLSFDKNLKLDDVSNNILDLLNKDQYKNRWYYQYSIKSWDNIKGDTKYINPIIKR